MELDKVDVILSIIDIIICIIDIGLMVYLFFYRFPPEKKKQNKFDKFGHYRIKGRRHGIHSLARNRRVP